MESFLKKDIENGRFELTIDTQIFDKDIILKAAFQYLDIGYFFFRIGCDSSIILQFTPKKGVSEEPENIIKNFSDTLLETTLRDKLEKDNRIIREAIISKAIYGPLDTTNFVSLEVNKTPESTIDFDKDIDEILKEIENDPDLDIDEEEIKKMLQEVENEIISEDERPKININMQGIKNSKDNFKR